MNRNFESGIRLSKARRTIVCRDHGFLENPVSKVTIPRNQRFGSVRFGSFPRGSRFRPVQVFHAFRRFRFRPVPGSLPVPVQSGSGSVRFQFSAVPRYHGTTVPWYHGTMVPWYHGTMEPWYHGQIGTLFCHQWGRIYVSRAHSGTIRTAKKGSTVFDLS